MGIQQSRFLRLIEAAEKFIRRDQRLRSHVAHVCAAVAAKRMTPEAGIEDIHIQLRLYPDYDPAEKTIAEERVWYNLTHRRNTMEANRIAKKRAADPNRRQRKITAETFFTEPDSPPPPIVQQMIDEDIRDNEDIFNDVIPAESADTDPEEAMATEAEKAEADRVTAQIRRMRGEQQKQELDKLTNKGKSDV